MEWSNDLSLQLIEAYRDRPVLWDVSHNYYKLANRRNEAWAEIAKLFNCDVMEVKKKMNSLLSSFRRERQKEGLRRSGTGPEEVYHSTWFAFNSLKFLFDRYRPRRHRHNFEDDDGDYEGEDFITDEEPDIPTDVLKMEYSEDSPVAGDSAVLERFSADGDKKPALKRKRGWSEETRLADACGLLKAAVTAGALARDDCAVYGEHVANKLRALDHRTRAIVQHAINNVLFEADMGKYSEAGAPHFQPAYYECATPAGFPPAWAPPTPQPQQAAAAAAAAAAMMCPPPPPQQAPAGAQAHASPTAASQPPHQSPRA
ncbi:uncharacterized protein LOC124743995 [Schistocerca piceifrons]|uniref:uncharacterized protein LOC124743995 n=1 Tax=Schistocerca piceifrons TaxID=274613 RepID=UPI001F5EEC0D|nr:uncharacterized protein LOC124743995 [Schistocerca piceifrons]XP_049938297.1 uncharacterized protein LOC126412629 [Schistocerca serialis cubense]